MPTGRIGIIRHITSLRGSQCYRCEHFLGKSRCRAFPYRDIPRDYRFGKVKHYLPLGNQVGNYVYEAKAEHLRDDAYYRLAEEKALAEYDHNQERLANMILEGLRKAEVGLHPKDQLIVTASGPLRSSFKFFIDFIPAERSVDLDLTDLEGVAGSLIRAIEAKSLSPRFVMIISGDGSYTFEQGYRPGEMVGR
ncbi:hypothetical protein [Flavilitoribacter nigricans]|uniref:Uncharacterized protein n=1 Tax=Flavilitoribacter nigricans (strain ATCC 23147 / DSM 23189 / NBRC 102662 / NCIMB 1420 / SS-2) TaxID=1122177 RepID=A0A2D0N1G3_FLAN2|nr:hypothetical protein [Flavilitoribacter nigricans]PHN02270.1 hypothetical protein CRP01_32750 [Flavilitoribacter nigricans DSM 23189 = NBRC 102662]